MNMWRLQNILFLLLLLLLLLLIASNYGTDVAEVIFAAGYEGSEIHISCPYSAGYETYMKYFCRGDCNGKDMLITSAEEEKFEEEEEQFQKGRYSVYQENHMFTVIISDLTLSDAGMYWCGVSRTGFDIYTKVKLDVKPDICCDSVSPVQGYEENSVSIRCPYESEFLNSLKYMCRGVRPSVCLQQAVVTSDNDLNGRFRLNDDKTSRLFTVTVTGVTKSDAGSYLCGVQRNNHPDDFTHVQLQVSDWCCVKSHAVSGSVGHPVTLQCPYPPQHVPNRKFLCKGERRRSCRNMVESQSQTDLRFTLQDNAASSSFSVTIVNLEASDAGTYWCGSDSDWSLGNYAKVQLSVVFPHQRSTATSATTVGAESSVKDFAALQIVAYTVPVVPLMVAFALVIVCKCSKKKGAELNVNRNLAAAETGDAMTQNNGRDEYQDVLCLNQEQLSALYHNEEDQPETLYENFSTHEHIYCNTSK